MGTKTVTVLIAALNEERDLPYALASIEGQVRKPDAVIVVDDGSSDSTAALARTYGASVIRLKERSGKKSRAQDAALPHIVTDLVVTIDADTELAPDALGKLVAPFEGERPPAGACGFVVSRDVKTLWQRGRFIEYLFGQSFYKFLQGEFNMMLVASGCIACYDVRIIRARGGFTSRSLAEDMDLTMSILVGQRRESARIVFIPDALAFTIDPKNFLLYRKQMRRWYAAFFQNLAIHRRDLLTFRNPLLSSLILFLLLDGVLGTAIFFGFPLVIIGMHWGLRRFFTIVLWQLGLEGMLASLFALSKGIRLGKRRKVLETIYFLRMVREKRDANIATSFAIIPRRYPGILGRILQVLTSIPCFFVTNFVNRFFFFWAFIREMVLRQKLETWEKGH